MTAGEFKRTVTVLGENTEKGKQKFQAELEETHQLFKQFVAQNRPHFSADFYRGRFAVAPMLDWTTRHCRYFHRQFTQYTLLYTEMVTTQADHSRQL